MDQDKFPTKGNLIRTQHTLALARRGYDLLDQKRNVLIREIASLHVQLQKLQARVDDAIKAAKAAFIYANMEMGAHRVAQLARGVPYENSVRVRTRSVMGVEVPIAGYEKHCAKQNLQYGLADTTITFDKAYLQFNEVKELIIALAALENTVYRLSANIRKTQKRANALQYIIIPRYETQLKFIQGILEERERDEFVRLKVGKGSSFT